MTSNSAHIYTLRHRMCIFGLKIKKGNKISGLSGELHWRGYLTFLSLFPLSLSKSLYFYVAMKIKWSKVNIRSGHDTYSVYQVSLYWNPSTIY